jgi:hypothetical protein
MSAILVTTRPSIGQLRRDARLGAACLRLDRGSAICKGRSSTQDRPTEGKPMKRVSVLVVAVALALLALAPAAGATIHPIVESFDCANAQAFANTPSNDPAEVPGQITSDFAALSHANGNAFSSFKLDGACGANG